VVKKSIERACLLVLRVHSGLQNKMSMEKKVGKNLSVSEEKSATPELFPSRLITCPPFVEIC